jgi:hypothetical protein
VQLNFYPQEATIEPVAVALVLPWFQGWRRRSASWVLCYLPYCVVFSLPFATSLFGLLSPPHSLGISSLQSLELSPFSRFSREVSSCDIFYVSRRRTPRHRSRRAVLFTPSRPLRLCPFVCLDQPVDIIHSRSISNINCRRLMRRHAILLDRVPFLYCCCHPTHHPPNSVLKSDFCRS